MMETALQKQGTFYTLKRLDNRSTSAIEDNSAYLRLVDREKEIQANREEAVAEIVHNMSVTENDQSDEEV